MFSMHFPTPIIGSSCFSVRSENSFHGHGGHNWTAVLGLECRENSEWKQIAEERGFSRFHSTLLIFRGHIAGAFPSQVRVCLLAGTESGKWQFSRNANKLLLSIPCKIKHHNRQAEVWATTNGDFSLSLHTHTLSRLDTIFIVIFDLSRVTVRYGGRFPDIISQREHARDKKSLNECSRDEMEIELESSL